MSFGLFKFLSCCFPVVLSLTLTLPNSLFSALDLSLAKVCFQPFSVQPWHVWEYVANIKSEKNAFEFPLAVFFVPWMEDNCKKPSIYMRCTIPSSWHISRSSQRQRQYSCVSASERLAKPGPTTNHGEKTWFKGHRPNMRDCASPGPTRTYHEEGKKDTTPLEKDTKQVPYI